MRKAIAMSTLLLALFAVGCAGSPVMTKEEAPITKETMLKCPNCGAEFTVGEGLSELERVR